MASSGKASSITTWLILGVLIVITLFAGVAGISQLTNISTPTIPETPDEFVTRGLSYEEFGEWELAIADYQSAVALDSNFALAYRSLGMVYDRTEQHGLALEAFEQYANLVGDELEQTIQNRIETLKAQ